jgi:hypothetical protein
VNTPFGIRPLAYADYTALVNADYTALVNADYTAYSLWTELSCIEEYL